MYLFNELKVTEGMKEADEQVCVRETETGIAACQHIIFPLNPCQNIASSPP